MNNKLLIMLMLGMSFVLVSCGDVTSSSDTKDDTDSSIIDDNSSNVEDENNSENNTEEVITYSTLFNSSGDAADLTYERVDWSSGSTITDSSDADYAYVIKVEAGSGWGADSACVAFTGLGDYQTDYTGITFKVKSDDLEAIVVKVPEVEKTYNFSDAEDLGDGWYEVTALFSSFSGTLSTTTEIGIHGGYSNGGIFYLTDIKMYSSEGGSSEQEEISVDTSTDSYTPGDNWTLSWSDEFGDGEWDSSIWTKQEMMDPHNEELEQYLSNDSVAFEADDCMILKADWYGNSYSAVDSYSSARIISNPGGQNGADSSVTGKTFKYGKIAARIKLPGGKGIWPAFWMLGDNISETGGDTNWPQCGEIDILESGAKDDANNGQGTVHGTVHRDPGTESNPVGNNQYISVGSYTLANNELFTEGFHVFEIEWDSSKIVWKVDGVEFGSKDITSDIENEFHKPFYIIFNIAVGGWFTEVPDSNTTFPQYMYIDWVRYYTNEN